MIVAMVAGMFMSCGDPNRGGPDDLAGGFVVARIGDYSITSEQVDNLTRQQAESLMGSAANLGPELEATFMAGVLGQLVEQGLVMRVAQDRGIRMTDADVMRLADREIDQRVADMRQQYVMMGRLEPDATEEEFQKVFKEEMGEDLAVLRKQSSDELATHLKVPEQRVNIVAHFSREALINALRDQHKPGDEDLRQSFESYEFKRVLITPEGAGDQSPREKAAEVLADVRGGLEFERAMDRYSGETPAPDKRVSETTVTLARRDLTASPVLSSLQTLEPGQISEVLPLPDGAGFYKLIAKSEDLPEDFEERKEEYRHSYADSQAAALLQADLDKLRKDGPIVWESEGYQALYDLYVVTSDFRRPREERAAEWRRIEEVAARAAREDAVGMKAAIYARMLAFQSRYQDSTPAEREDMRQERIEVLEAVLVVTESPQMRMELAELFAENQDGEGVFRHLLAGARANAAPDESGQQMYNEINSHIERYQSSGLLTAEQIAQLEEVQARWRAERAQQEIYEEEMRRQEEEMRKKYEEEEQNRLPPTPRNEAQPPSGN
jgi:hypothetical protein